MGHLEDKCTVKEELRYGPEVVKTFENWLRRIPGFREQLKARQQKKEDIRATKIGEYVKNRPEGTTQLSKPRFPPLWSGQKYD